ncbi:MAG: M1 family aminopeptidase [bacterium]|nr:M1 family aminopeptidase [bacterium]
MNTLRVFSLALLALLGFTLSAWGASNPWDEDFAPPENPKQFHAQEAARLLAFHEQLQESPLLSTQADYDVLYYDITLDLRGFYSQTIAGSVLVQARSLAPDLDELVLDLCSNLIVDSCVVAGGARPFTSGDHTLTIALDRAYGENEIVEARVVYHGTPCQTSTFTSFSFYNRPVGSRQIPSISTLSEPQGARDWWPSKDDPSDKADSARISLIVADTLTATSNGVLESLTPLPPSSRKFTWFERHPISTYLICASATNYAHYREWFVSQTGDSVPLDHYPYPERLANAQESWNPLPQMMAFCEQIYGTYPFVDEKYGHTMFNWGGAMEHQCNTSYGRSITTGTHTYDYIVQHELSHMWWGDNVTLGTWADVWLNEGFASYSEALYYENRNGPDMLQDYMTSSWGNDVVDPSGPVYDPAELFSSNTVYDKGAWIVHMLRGWVRDDELFFAALAEYRARHTYGCAVTSEFFADIADVIGYDAEPFLHAYLYRTNRPHFAVSFGSGTVDGTLVTVVRIRQTQTDPDTTFRTRLDLRFTTAADTTTERVENSEWNERYYFALGFAPTGLAVDPRDWVLKEVANETLPLTILNQTVAEAMTGEDYQYTLTAIGGNGAIVWSVVDGDLPEGIELPTNGTLAGSATEAGVFTFKVRAQDGALHSDEIWLTLTVASSLPPPSNVTVYPSDSDHIMLRWSPAADADSYRVYRAPEPDWLDEEWILTTTDTFALDTLDTMPLPEDTQKTWFYRVRSVGTP